MLIIFEVEGWMMMVYVLFFFLLKIIIIKIIFGKENNFSIKIIDMVWFIGIKNINKMKEE